MIESRRAHTLPCYGLVLQVYFNEWMNENLQIAHKKFHTKSWMFTVPNAHKCLASKSKKKKKSTKIDPTVALPQNWDEEINKQAYVITTHKSNGTNHIHTIFLEYTHAYVCTYANLHVYMYTLSTLSSQLLPILTSRQKNLVTIKELSLQWSFERPNIITFPDASRLGIPDAGSNIPESLLAILLCLRNL